MTDDLTMMRMDLYLKTKYSNRKLNSLGQLTVTDIDSITDILFTIYGTAWDRLWKSYTAEYNPIWNVDGTETETETRDLTTKYTGTDNYSHSGNDSVASTGNDKVVNSGQSSSNTNNSTYGFNSSSASPSDGSNTASSQSLNETTTYGKTDTTNYNSSNNNTKDLTNTDSGSITRTKTRGGNIGVTMTQQLLQADLDYWSQQLSRFYEKVVTDIVNELTYKIHTEETDEYAINGTCSVTVRQILTSGVPIAGISTDGTVRQIQDTGTEVAAIVKE